RRGAHDLSRLAIAALHDVELGPRDLHGVAAVGRKPLDRGDAAALRGIEGRDTSADGRAVEVHGAGPAERPAAAVFGTRESREVAQGPEEGPRGGGLQLAALAVDSLRTHGRAVSC